jgi:hypothetical protein
VFCFNDDNNCILTREKYDPENKNYFTCEFETPDGNF